MKSIISQSSLQADSFAINARPFDDLRINQEVVASPFYEQFKRPGAQCLLPKAFQAKAVHRFVILVPNGSFSISNLSFTIGQFTLPGTSLLFVAKPTEPDQELTICRQLALLVNMADFPGLQVRSRVIKNGSWQEAVKEIWREGDLIICLEDHKVRQNLLGSIPLGREIFSTQQVPVLILQDIHILGQSAFQKVVREIVTWALFLGIILLFSMLQIQIDHANSGWQWSVLECMTVIVEIYVIWKINEFLADLQNSIVLNGWVTILTKLAWK